MSTAGDTLLPINPRAYAILLLLLEGPSHGYRIKQEVETRSDGQVLLDAGALYRTIAKMVRDGLIEEQTAPEAGDARRRYYGLTSLGDAVTRAETRRLARLIEASPVGGLLESGDAPA